MGCSSETMQPAAVQQEPIRQLKLEAIQTSTPCIGPYSHAIRANGFVYFSGQLPLQ